jgi:nanoRNase/pAp phosphatase (c-di-AMP/oligoRNAs hydrolase)
MKTTRLTRSDCLLKILADYEQVFVVTHDTPDPDAIASGWAVMSMVQEKLGKRVRLIGGGEIVRAENKHMLQLLRPPIELVRKVQCGAGTAVVLVDCGPDSENHLFAEECIVPVAVIDHHSLNGRRGRRLEFMDVRPQVAASATICASYLREQKLEPSAELATALLYAIRTETQGCETHFSRLDRAMLLWLTKLADPSRLAEIENAPLSVAYFADLALALQNAMLYYDAAFCLLPRANGAEIVGEVADLLIRCESVRRVLCGAIVHGNLVFSARTKPGSGDATQLVRATLEGIGQGGGHRHRAGGKVSLSATGPKIDEDIQDELRNRWLAACGLPPQHGLYLIARHEIVDNL